MLRARPIFVEPLRRAIRPDGPADFGPFVPVESEPSQVFENRRVRFGGRTVGVRIFDAQNERAVVTAREQPVEQRRADVADVQMPGRARGEADAHAWIRLQARAAGFAGQQRDRVHRNRLVAAERVDLFVRLAFDAHRGDVDPNRASRGSRASPECAAAASAARRSRPRRCSTRRSRPPRRCRRRSQQRDAVGALPFRIGVRENAGRYRRRRPRRESRRSPRGRARRHLNARRGPCRAESQRRR